MMSIKKPLTLGVMLLTIGGLFGCNNKDTGLLDVGSSLPQKETTQGSGTIKIDGNSEDGQTFPVGIPIALEATLDFSDGTQFSTNRDTNDSELMSWSIAGNTEASISDEGVLTTNGVPANTVLTITATGKAPYENETDSIEIIVSDAMLVEGSSIVAIDGNSVDGQKFP
ncbi:hypothetical protein L1076_13475, partial [Vibrio sp. MMG022]